MRAQQLYEDEAVRVTGLGPLFTSPGAGGLLVVSFTGIGAGDGERQSEEFVGSAARADRSALFVADKTRSWYNSPGVHERIVEQVRLHSQGADALVTLGNSMGGFGALLFAAPLKARLALAFGPQVSVSRGVVPGESRWSQFTSKIGPMRFEHVSDHMAAGADYVVIHGSGGKDAFHIEAFRPAPWLRHYVVPHGRHNIAEQLKEAGALSTIIDAACADDLPGLDAAIRGCGGALRAEVGPVMDHLRAKRAARQGRAEGPAARG